MIRHLLVIRTEPSQLLQSIWQRHIYVLIATNFEASIQDVNWMTPNIAEPHSQLTTSNPLNVMHKWCIFVNNYSWIQESSTCKPRTFSLAQAVSLKSNLFCCVPTVFSTNLKIISVQVPIQFPFRHPRLTLLPLQICLIS